MFETLINNISKTVVGNVDKIKLTLAAIISEGSILIEDNPGSCLLYTSPSPRD